VKESQVRKQMFFQAVNQMSLNSKNRLKQVVQTRWNSTYLIIENDIYYGCAFSYLEMIEPNFKYCPKALEWEKLDGIGTFLSCFYHATCEFSSTKYPTANLYFPMIFMIYMNLKE
jgi:hypothetical protein